MITKKISEKFHKNKLFVKNILQDVLGNFWIIKFPFQNLVSFWLSQTSAFLGCIICNN